MKDNITITLPTSEFEQIRKALMIRLDVVTSNIKNGNSTKEMENEYVELSKISAELQAYIALNKLKVESQNEPKENTKAVNTPINIPPYTPPIVSSQPKPESTTISYESTPSGLIYDNSGVSMTTDKEYDNSFREDINEDDFTGKDIKEKTYKK